MFQRAFYTAQVLDIDKKTHDAMFDAVWKTGQLAVFDPRTQKLKVPAPGIEDAARFYAQAVGVKPETFVATASSFGVDVKMHQAEQQLIRAKRRSPRRRPSSSMANTALPWVPAGGDDQLIELVKYLVARESASRARSRSRTEGSG